MKTTPHKLELWRSDNGITRKELSRMIGLKSMTPVYNWERLGIIPTPKNALAVENITGGAVTATYMLYQSE